MMKARAQVCSSCGQSNFVRDHSASSGELTCQNCGTVANENPIVSEVQFGESASGAAMVQGAMVGADQARANFNMRNSMESREQTLLNAKSKIKKIAMAMRIPDYIVESASGWFKLALVQNFVQGRRSQNVIAACLYVACRHEKTHHLLIDFSSRLQISVYSLGSTYLKLVRALQIQRLPIADPSLFIQHFADRLSLGDKTAKVCKDATKLAHRMSSDWIHEGRRPAGIAGACVLLAARMNHINRTHAEIVAVARVGEETIQKRLNEFKNTTSANLTISEFRDSQNSNDSLPPSYKKNRAIEKKVHLILKEREMALRRFQQLAKGKQLISTLGIELGERIHKDGRRESKDADHTSETHDDDANEGSSASLTGTNKHKQNTRTASDTNEEDASTELEGSKKQTQSLFLQPDEDEEDEDEEDEEDGKEEDDDEDEDEDEDEDAFGFNELPENDDPVNDKDYEQRSVTILNKSIAFRERRLRETSIEANKSRKRSRRLDNMSTTYSSSAREGGVSKGVQMLEELKARERIERQDALLKSVLDGGSFDDDELERTLDRFLAINQSKSGAQGEGSDGSYTEAEANDDDGSRTIELNRPRNLVKNNPTTSDLLSKVRDDELLDENDDDEEVLSIKLSDAEHEQKRQIWISLNHDFLIAQEKKRLKSEADELTGNTSGQPKKRRKIKEASVDPVLNDTAVANAIRSIGEDGQSMSPAESAKQVFSKKIYSKKINYLSINELFNQNPT
ncbi:putative transcription factor [Clavispora lusitaniae]|uniref:B-related factor 1 n=2 Tax=Clavispora lusitaniae TaxID=36911 RepID=A0AA91SZK8_CLALS|nr:transcription factor TFIIIB subunit brf1 [Clavispora lusitaniae]KAF7580259.1 Transcription factor TFIIB repeat family protein [Clavispora lusitaniae]OVF04336.1 putative transcription factor IIIB subunit [Clavispora lusitaniae]QFZ27824.1 putative transcription factor [Clavispora lusitaniae]QFZ32869.1 putative transcription factor [Clavispora lusitaniae]